MPDFRDNDIKNIAVVSQDIVNRLKTNLNYNFEHEQNQINKIVEKYFN